MIAMEIVLLFDFSVGALLKLWLFLSSAITE